MLGNALEGLFVQDIVARIETDRERARDTVATLVALVGTIPENERMGGTG